MRPLAPLVVALAAATALAGCGGGAASGDPDPASVMPARSAIYLEAVVRPEGDQEESARALAAKVLRTPDPGKRIQEMLEGGIREELPAGTSYQKDIKPWLGKRIGLTVTNLAADEPGFVAAIATRDADAAADFLVKVEEASKADKRSFKGTDHWIEDDGTTVGMVEDFIVVGETQAEFKRAVEAAEGDALSETSRFEDAMESLDDDRMGGAYLDLKSFADLAADGQLGAEGAALFRSALGNAKPVTAALLATADSASVELFATIPEGKGAELFGAGESPELVKEAPSNAWAVAGLAEVGRAVRTGLESFTGGLGSAVLGPQIEKELGLSLERDLFSWIGDVMVFVQGKSLADLRGAAVIAVTDAERARAALPRLVGIARAQLGAPFRPFRLRGADQAFAAALPGGPGPLVAAMGGDRVVIALGEEAAQAALSPSETISGSGLYDRAEDAVDDLDPGLIVDARVGLDLIEQVAGGDPDFAQAKPYLELLDLIASGSERDGDEIRRLFTVKLR